MNEMVDYNPNYTYSQGGAGVGASIDAMQGFYDRGGQMAQFQMPRLQPQQQNFLQQHPRWQTPQMNWGMSRLASMFRNRPQLPGRMGPMMNQGMGGMQGQGMGMGQPPMQDANGDGIDDNLFQAKQQGVMAGAQGQVQQLQAQRQEEYWKQMQQQRDQQLKMQQQAQQQMGQGLPMGQFGAGFAQQQNVGRQAMGQNSYQFNSPLAGNGTFSRSQGRMPEGSMPRNNDPRWQNENQNTDIMRYPGGRPNNYMR